MSEEEKHAIEFFNKVIYQIGEEDIMKNNCILLNLIDKLQKENNKYIEEQNNVTIMETEYFKDKYISKDKIRAEIKELENKKEQYTEQPLIYHILKSQLEELLGE